MLKMAQKTNSVILALTMRNAALERDARRLVERVTGLETNSEVQEKLIERVGQITEAVKGTSNRHGSGKPSEYKAFQALKNFTGERSKFRDWNDKFLNALAQVKPSYRQVMKLLNKKLGTLDGCIPEQDEDDIIKIMSGRLTADEYMNASQGKCDEDDNKGDLRVY